MKNGIDLVAFVAKYCFSETIKSSRIWMFCIKRQSFSFSSKWNKLKLQLPEIYLLNTEEEKDEDKNGESKIVY